MKRRWLGEVATALPTGLLIGVLLALLGVFVQHLSPWAVVAQGVLFGALAMAADVGLAVWHARR